MFYRLGNGFSPSYVPTLLPDPSCFELNSVEQQDCGQILITAAAVSIAAYPGGPSEPPAVLRSATMQSDGHLPCCIVLHCASSPDVLMTYCNKTIEAQISALPPARFRAHRLQHAINICQMRSIERVSITVACPMVVGNVSCP